MGSYLWDVYVWYGSANWLYQKLALKINISGRTGEGIIMRNMRCMDIDLSRFKVIHGDKVMNAVSLIGVEMGEIDDFEHRDITVKPKLIDVLAINEDGNLVSIMDEAWTFQFLPIVHN